jgi:hypothetical protein
VTPRRRIQLATRAIIWGSAILTLGLVAREVSPLAAALTASVALNVHLWRRQHTRAGVPPYIVDEINRLRARLNQSEQALRTAVTTNRIVSRD